MAVTRGWGGGNWEILVKRYKLPVIRWICSGDLIFIRVTTFNNIIYFKVAKKINLKCSHCARIHTRIPKVLCAVMLTNPNVLII